MLFLITHDQTFSDITENCKMRWLLLFEKSLSSFRKRFASCRRRTVYFNSLDPCPSNSKHGDSGRPRGCWSRRDYPVSVSVDCLNLHDSRKFRWWMLDRYVCVYVRKRSDVKDKLRRNFERRRGGMFAFKWVGYEKRAACVYCHVL